MRICAIKSYSLLLNNEIIKDIKMKPKKKEIKKRVTIALYPSMIEKAKERAVKQNRSFSNYIENLILAEMEG